MTQDEEIKALREHAEQETKAKEKAMTDNADLINRIHNLEAENKALKDQINVKESTPA